MTLKIPDEVVKISDSTCPICSQLSEFDLSVCLVLGISFTETHLKFLHNYPEYYQYVLQNIVDSEGLVDVPIYLVIEGNTITKSFLGNSSLNEDKFVKELLNLH